MALCGSLIFAMDDVDQERLGTPVEMVQRFVTDARKSATAFAREVCDHSARVTTEKLNFDGENLVYGTLSLGVEGTETVLPFAIVESQKKDYISSSQLFKRQLRVSLKINDVKKVLGMINLFTLDGTLARPQSLFASMADLIPVDESNQTIDLIAMKAKYMAQLSESYKNLSIENKIPCPYRPVNTHFGMCIAKEKIGPFFFDVSKLDDIRLTFGKDNSPQLNGKYIADKDSETDVPFEIHIFPRSDKDRVVYLTKVVEDGQTLVKIDRNGNSVVWVNLDKTYDNYPDMLDFGFSKEEVLGNSKQLLVREID